MSWLDRRRPKKAHPWPPRESLALGPSFNDVLKELDRRGELGDFMARWRAFERDRENTP